MNDEQRASQEEIGKFLKQLREENKMTQEDVAKELHYSRDVISQIERGISMPSYDKAIVLSKIFNVSIYEIYGARKISDGSKKEIQEIMDNTT